jgi:hypothetical protein
MPARSAAAIVLAVAGCITVEVPVIPDEQHPLAACMIAAAIACPVAAMLERHAQVDGIADVAAGYQDRRPVDYGRWRVGAQFHPAEEARLADTDAHLRTGGQGCNGKCRANQQFFHDAFSTSFYASR